MWCHFNTFSVKLQLIVMAKHLLQTKKPHHIEELNCTEKSIPKHKFSKPGIGVLRLEYVMSLGEQAQMGLCAALYIIFI